MQTRESRSACRGATQLRTRYGSATLEIASQTNALHSQLCELGRRNRNELALMQNDVLRSANQLPPLAGRAEHDCKHKHKKEDSNKRIESPDTRLPHQLGSLG